jgi:hypothetical protein
MSSGIKRHRRITPMPIESSFPPPNRETVHSKVIPYTLTPEQLAEVIAKYGPPLMKLSERKGNHYMTRGKVKKDGDVGSKGKANGKRKDDSKGKVDGSSSAKVSGL